MIDFDSIIGFDWDAGKQRKSEVKHGVTQAEAEEVFFNNPLLISANYKHSEAESRYLALGKTNKDRGLMIIFTLRQGSTLIRVISVRDQHRKERDIYAKTNQRPSYR
ncbi:MAG: hypothetical protein RL369_383 [Pseudomonadota bacterium]|jgi:uncharacterized DUF497 family protein